jgi:hypothetical protein
MNDHYHHTDERTDEGLPVAAQRYSDTLTNGSHTPTFVNNLEVRYQKLQAAALRFAAGLLTGAPADDLRRRAAELDGQPLCKGGWRAGIIAPPGPEGPPDGARCTYADKHPGWCSFIDEAIGRGWVPPAGLIPRRPA